MKTYSHIPPTSRFIDIAPMWAALERLCAMSIVIIEQNACRGLVANSLRVLKMARAIGAADMSNYRLGLKLRMLDSTQWRRRVLKDLGGARKLSLWQAAMDRARLRKDEPPHNPYADSSWRKTPERLAEEDRQKARRRLCEKACCPPKTFRDPFRMDQEGQFRLAPVPRGPRAKINPACRPFALEDYEYDPVPLSKVTGWDAPVMVWPIEFKIAEALDEPLRQNNTMVQTLRALITADERGEPLPSAPVIASQRPSLEDEDEDEDEDVDVAGQIYAFLSHDTFEGQDRYDERPT